MYVGPSHPFVSKKLFIVDKRPFLPSLEIVNFQQEANVRAFSIQLN